MTAPVIDFRPAKLPLYFSANSEASFDLVFPVEYEAGVEADWKIAFVREDAPYGDITFSISGQTITLDFTAEETLAMPENMNWYMKDLRTNKTIIAGPVHRAEVGWGGIGRTLRNTINVLVGGSSVTLSVPVSNGEGGGGTSDHSLLTNRNLANQHTTAAITGLDTTLNDFSDALDALATAISSKADASATSAAFAALEAAVDALFQKNDPHTVAAFMLCDQSMDPTAIAVPLPATAPPMYLYSGRSMEYFEEGEVPWPITGLWKGTSEVLENGDVTLAPMERVDYTPKTADFWISRAFIDARGGIDGPSGYPLPGATPYDDGEFPQIWESPGLIIGYISPINAPDCPVWSLPMEYSWGGAVLSPSIGHLRDVNLSVPPSAGDTLLWEEASGGSPGDPGYVAAHFKPGPVPSALITSVNGQTGEVVLSASDVGADPAGTAATEVASLVGSAPAVLDTLGELADALADDASFAATVTTSLAGKQPTSEKGAANGYAPLDSGLLVPVANLGTGSPTGSKFLRDDRVWAVPTATPVDTSPLGTYPTDSYLLLSEQLGTGYAATTPGASASSSNNLAVYIPFYIMTARSIKALALNVTTGNAGASAVLRMGIHSDSSGAPGTLVVDAGSTSINATGLKELTFASTALSVGRYWYVVVFQNIDTAGSNPAFAGCGSGTSAAVETAPTATNLMFPYTTKSSVSGALSSNPASLTLARSNVTKIPHVWAKVA